MIQDKYVVVFCVRSQQDPALPLVEDLVKTYSDVPTKVYSTSSEVGVNPKINNIGM